MNGFGSVNCAGQMFRCLGSRLLCLCGSVKPVMGKGVCDERAGTVSML